MCVFWGWGMGLCMGLCIVIVFWGWAMGLPWDDAHICYQGICGFGEWPWAWTRAWHGQRVGDVVASYVAWAWAGVGMGMGVECHDLGLQACTLPCIAFVD